MSISPRRWRLVILSLVAVGMLFTACRPSPQSPGEAPLSPGVESAVRERGQAITAQAFALLSMNLAQALESGGIRHALPYCSEKAYPLTELVAATNAVAIRRVTHRPRNPTNAATAAEIEVLRGFQLALGRGEKPQPAVRSLGDGRVTFYSPIVITNPLCLQCHGVLGQELSVATQTLLAELYPRDEAIGFRLGDLRGMWRVDFGATGTF